MKKFHIFALAFLMMVMFGVSAFAATKADSASLANGIMSVGGVADLSSGDTQEVDTYGNAAVEVKSNGNTLAIDSSGNAAVELQGDSANEFVTKSVSYKTSDGAAYNGAATVYGVILASATAGDKVMLYDASSATGTPVFDISVAANTTESVFIPGGVAFSTDVYVDVIGTAPIAMIVYKSS